MGWRLGLSNVNSAAGEPLTRIGGGRGGVKATGRSIAGRCPRLVPTPALWLDAGMAATGELHLWQTGAAPWRSLATAASCRALSQKLRGRGILGVARADALRGAALRSWALRVRQAGLVAAVVVPADCLTPRRLATLDVAVPLLLVVTAPARRPREAWTGARTLLSQLRGALLRVAIGPAAPCQVGALRGDLSVRLSRGPGAPVAPEPAWAPACAGCAARSRCPGAGGVAPDDRDVRALPPLLSNQFDLIEAPGGWSPQPTPLGVAGALDPAVDGSRGPAPAEETCPAARGLWVVAERHREVVLLQDGPQVRRFVCDPGAWSPPQLARVIDTLGQVYLDRSGKARLDDFERDLELLERCHEPHPHLAAGATAWCPGLWRRADRQPFGAEEDELLGVLRGLAGTVVDVGAGPVRYLEELRAAMAQGRVRYVAVEPDASALRRSGSALPHALLCQGTGEALPVGSGRADAVLLLRSYNHLRDVPRAMIEAARILRPGGVLVMCDNVAFGLCRTPEQITRARALSSDQTPFEHHRNANAHEAVAALLAAEDCFEVTRCDPVARGSSNQWLVVARRKPTTRAVSG